VVFALQGPANVDPVVWLANSSQRAWSMLPFPTSFAPPLPQPPSNIPPGQLSVSALNIQLGGSTSTNMLVTAVVADVASANEQQLYTLNVTTPGAAWSYLPQEQNFALLPGFQIGRMNTTSWGIYKLYELNSNWSLTFLPSTGSFGVIPGNAISLTPPAGASAIASLIYPPPSGGGQVYSDLFVAAPGAIYYFPYNSPAHSAGVQILTGQNIQNVTEIHAVYADDDGDGAMVFLWWVNQGGALVYASAPVASLSSSTAWMPPVPLLPSTSAISPVFGASAEEFGICALPPTPPGVSTAKTANCILMLSRNATTGHWQNAILPTPSTDDCITLQTYTTRVQLMNGSVPHVAQSVPVTVSVDCTLLMNGQSTNVSAGSSVTLTTDSFGALTFIYPVSSLAGATFTLTLPDSTTVDVNAAANTTSTLGTLSDDDLNTATYPTPSGGTGTIVPKNTDANTVTAIRKGVNQLAQTQGQLPTARSLTAATKARNLAAVRATLGANSLLVDLGDLVQFAVNVAEEIASVVLTPLAEGFQIVVNLADWAYTAVIHTVEDAIHAIGAFFAWLGNTFDDIFRWLGYLFDWSAITKLSQDLAAFYNQMMTSMSATAADLAQPVANFLANVQSNILQSFNASTALGPVSGASSVTSAYNAQAPATPAVNGTNVQTDSRMGWVSDRANTPISNPPAAVRRLGGSSSPLDTAFSGITTSIGTILTNLASDIQNLSNGTLAPKEFLITATGQVAALGVADLSALAQAAFSEFAGLISTTQSALNAEIDIPILSALYYDATNQKLDLLNLSCLLQAVACNICSVIATGQPATAPAAAAGAQDTISQLPGLIAQFASQPKAGLARAGLRDSAPACEGFSGALFVTQGLLDIVLGAIDISSEGSGVDPMFRPIYVMETITRLGRAGCGLYDLRVSDAAYTASWHLVIMEFLVNWVLLILAFTVEDETLESVDVFDTFISLVWGAWEIVNDLSDGDCDVEKVFEAIVELLEVPNFILIKAQQPEAAAVGVAIRGVAGMGAGICRIANAS
jgi:hypothetical protein